MSEFTKKEKEFANELIQYEDKWVAISRHSGNEKVVASGDRITDAQREVQKKGAKDVVYRKVPSADKIFIA